MVLNSAALASVPDPHLPDTDPEEDPEVLGVARSGFGFVSCFNHIISKSVEKFTINNYLTSLFFIGR